MAEDGRAAHVSGEAHEFTPEEAREAGAKSHVGPGASGAGSGSDSDVDSKGSQGASNEQHAGAGSQSHKNDDR